MSRNHVLIPIDPQRIVCLAECLQTMILTKTRPKVETPFKCYLYAKGNKHCNLWKRDDGKLMICARPNALSLNCINLSGYIVGEFTCDRVYQYTTMDLKEGVDISTEDICKMTMMSEQQIMEYELSNIEDFKLCRYGVYGWHIEDVVIYDKPLHISCAQKHGTNRQTGNRLKRPPIQWCYIDKIGEAADEL